MYQILPDVKYQRVYMPYYLLYLISVRMVHSSRYCHWSVDAFAVVGLCKDNVAFDGSSLHERGWWFPIRTNSRRTNVTQICVKRFNLRKIDKV